MEKKKPIKSEKKTLATFFTKIRIPKRMSRKRVAHADNIIVSLFTMGCCKVLSSLNVWEFFFNREKQLPYGTWTIASSKIITNIKLMKHVKFDLRDNITSRDVTKSLSAEQQEPEVRVPETYKKKKDRSIGQWIWPGFPIIYKTPAKVKVKVTWTQL